MARHPEVKEKEIIEAGLLIQSKGKMANPGAIRAQLGFKGGLVRIRQVWEKYQNSHFGNTNGEEMVGMKFDELPSEIADASEELLMRQRREIENIVVESFLRCQRLFETRLDGQVQKYEADMAYYKEYEMSADESITKLEKELSSVQSEATDLAKQNASLLIANAELKGQLFSYEKTCNGAATLASGKG